MSLAYAANLAGVIIAGMLTWWAWQWPARRLWPSSWTNPNPNAGVERWRRFPSPALEQRRGRAHLRRFGSVDRIFSMYLSIAGIAGGGLLLTLANRAYLK